MFAEMVDKDPSIVQQFKMNDDIPMETSPALSEIQSGLLKHPQIPAESHARDHFFAYNEEQITLVHDVLRHYKGHVTGSDFPEKIRHKVVDNRVVSFGDPNKPTVVHQLKIALKKPVPNRRVWLPASDEHKVHLVRRHGHTPGLDFLASLDDTTIASVTTVDTMIITLRETRDTDSGTTSYTLGTAFAGSSFPGSADNDGTGILYKWYGANADGNKNRRIDATLFYITIRAGKIPALLEPADFAALIKQHQTEAK